SARGTGPLAPGALGSVALLTFTVSGAARPGRSVLNLEATDGVTATAVADNTFNTLTLSPAPTNGADDAADGAVTILAAAGPLPERAAFDGAAGYPLAGRPAFTPPAAGGTAAVA